MGTWLAFKGSIDRSIPRDPTIHPSAPVRRRMTMRLAITVIVSRANECHHLAIHRARTHSLSRSLPPSRSIVRSIDPSGEDTPRAVIRSSERSSARMRASMRERTSARETHERHTRDERASSIASHRIASHTRTQPWKRYARRETSSFVVVERVDMPTATNGGAGRAMVGARRVLMYYLDVIILVSI